MSNIKMTSLPSTQIMVEPYKFADIKDTIYILGGNQN
ncbi:hypothetical protein Aeqsu_1553 [Aequorivita sublithincola DSM 14238]|uniref:Uncharacterized protein n=1 Tax=Aequorivita sublithincola (strain DSM 14238 / LMG 21431 / ACAM 643 / 9-3) TaxID=746697 RepID=I3YVM0_AEQSU|nr:hypothetical protein Aeqsu_1553 [Aequorivita sublithincola DSM 14238]